MSFSWWCKDKQGRELFKEFGVHSQGLGLGPNCDWHTPAEFSLSEIRNNFCRVDYKDKVEDAARDAILVVQSMVKTNKAGLHPRHCDTCTCPKSEPEGWSEQEIAKMLAIPITRVWRCGGGW